MKRIQFTIAFFLISFILSAQATFVNTVKIEYEKTVDTRPVYKD